MLYIKKLIPKATILNGLPIWRQRILEYYNKFPFNCGYCVAKGKSRGDCWCTFPKTEVWSIFSGVPMWNNDTPGAYYYLDCRYLNGQIINAESSSGLPDWDGQSILNGYCEDISFQKMISENIAPALLLNGDATHMGQYAGEFTIGDGYIYNTDEMTPHARISPRMVSYVDEYGNCYDHKGGTFIRKWARAGKMTGIVDYTGDAPTPPQPAKPWSIDNVAVYIMRGTTPDGAKVPNGMDNRKTFFGKYGYSTVDVQQAQDIVNNVYAKHDIDVLACDLAMRFISGEAGDGVTMRRQWIADKYPKYDTETLFRKTQDKVNDYLS